MSEEVDNVSLNEKLAALAGAARYNPSFTAGLTILSACVAFLEGVGLTFIYPIIEVARSDGPPADTDFIMGLFLDTYELLGIPFDLGYLVVGVSLIMTVRFSSSFVAGWASEVLEKRFERSLRSRAFKSALEARIAHFDNEGSDDILNAIITETRYAAQSISGLTGSLQTLALAGVYLSVMFYIAPLMTIFALSLLGGLTYLIRNVIEPAATVGTRVARANERVQQTVQAGTQGIRDVKLFGLEGEVIDEFDRSIDDYTRAEIDLGRNEQAIQDGYDLAAAVSLFILIYVGFTATSRSLGALSIFLFAMFRLSPLVSRLNQRVYGLEGDLAHLVRTQAFLEKLEGQAEQSGERSVSQVDHVEFDDVHFSYTDDEQVLSGVSLEIERGDFVSFVGQSGAGKSTIVSLLTRMYDPDRGEIRGDDVPIEEYDLEQWRSRIAVVRQNPHIFNGSLRENVTIANRDATRAEIERVCEIAKVTEFLDELPSGYDSQLGDDGVRLSGGQRQRVALARALLKDADFLVLDEATSDLDTNLEWEVQAGIESMDRDYAIVTIAHRLSTVKNSDVIYTLEDGEIIESGTHQELLDDDGEYADLYSIQSSG